MYDVNPRQRWWLREVTSDKSLGKGLYEATTLLTKPSPGFWALRVYIGVRLNSPVEDLL